MKKRFLFLGVFLALAMCLTLLPTTALANSTSTSGGITTACNHALGTDGKCSECGKTLIAQMTSITSEGGTATAYLAALDSSSFSEIDLLNAAFGSSSITVVKLLKDVISTTPSAMLNFTSPNQTLDLNGHKLDTNGGGITIPKTSSPASEDNFLPVLTITDSSTNENGELKAQVELYSGSLTINSGKLTAKNSDGSNGLISINKASMTISGTAKVSCSTIKIVTHVTVIGPDGESGSLTIQDNAEITGGIAVNTENSSLTMTGGKIQMQPVSDPEGEDMICVYGGKVRISGGKINNTLIVSSGDVELSGGIYSKLGEVMNDLPSVADLLKNGYAYYSKESDTSESYTKLVSPTILEEPDDSISMVENVAVNPHVCKFTQSNGVWICDCGRIAVQTPIPYVNEDGKTAYCTKYKEIDDNFSNDILSDSWYVVTAADPIELIMLTALQDTHLILKNNTAMTMTGGIDTSVGKTLSIYGQPPANGETAGKLMVNEYSDIGGCIGCGGNFIVNGGDVTVNASFSISGLSDSFDIPDGRYSVMVVGDLTANGGKLTVNQPSGTNYGIFVGGDLTVNGGSITVNGTPASAGSGHADNRDICAQTLYMQSGTVTGSVLAQINDLKMTGGTLKLKDGSILVSVAASPLTAPLMDGCAYFQVSLSGYPTNIVENEVGFVTLGNLTALNAAKNNTTVYYVRNCEHSSESGICDYCGKNLSPAPSGSSSTPSGGSPAPTYTVTAPATENGSVNISPRNAKKGTAVTITVTPDSGYTLETLTVTDKNGKEIELTNNGDGTYTFNMPGGEVEVTTTFMEDNSMLNLFVDVTADKYYYDAVLWAAKNGITGGIDENHFGPDLSCTRAQLVTFLWRVAGCPVVNYAMNFTDVDDSYYSEAVRWAASLGIVDGYGNDLFGSDDTITREQMATILYRFAMAMGMDTTQGGMAAHEYSDYESISSYAVDAIQWAVNAGIMQGYDNNLMPAQPCTRAQIVTMLYRLLGE